MGHKTIDESGARYGRLVVLASTGPQCEKSGHKSARWVCACDCGKVTETRGVALRSGKARSCGCLRTDTARRRLALPFGESGRNRALQNAKDNARRRGYSWAISDVEAFEMMKSACHYCATPPAQVSKGRHGDYVYNGIDRVDNDIGYIAGNVVACCGMCNGAKNKHSLVEFQEWIRRVYNHSVKPSN